MLQQDAVSCTYKATQREVLRLYQVKENTSLKNHCFSYWYKGNIFLDSWLIMNKILHESNIEEMSLNVNVFIKISSNCH